MVKGGKLARGTKKFFNGIGNDLKRKGTKQFLGQIVKNAATSAGYGDMLDGVDIGNPEGGKLSRGTKKFFNGIGNELKRKETKQFLGQIAKNAATAAGYGSLLEGVEMGNPEGGKLARGTKKFFNGIGNDLKRKGTKQFLGQIVKNAATSAGYGDVLNGVDIGNPEGGSMKSKMARLRRMKGGAMRRYRSDPSQSQINMGTDHVSGDYLGRNRGVTGSGFVPLGH